jgi:hypothetical protein
MEGGAPLGRTFTLPEVTLPELVPLVEAADPGALDPVARALPGRGLSAASMRGPLVYERVPSFDLRRCHRDTFLSRSWRRQPVPDGGLSRD